MWWTFKATFQGHGLEQPSFCSADACFVFRSFLRFLCSTIGSRVLQKRSGLCSQSRPHAVISSCFRRGHQVRSGGRGHAVSEKSACSRHDHKPCDTCMLHHDTSRPFPPVACLWSLQVPRTARRSRSKKKKKSGHLRRIWLG